ncbi:MAG TPA: DNA mismatch repair protein MutS [Candidatus Kapabacteria bacterium]|nr:DNA mismatch repair protein MutS [Candidatus Kapabacteria bacterium]
MSGKQTPLMKQYYQIKEKYPDTVLFFRMGDFFETFDNDAVITSKTCGIALTKRNQGMEDATPLAGFPHHHLDTYLPKVVKAGYRVAVCEQLEDPKYAKGLVKRGVIEVVTPGVALYDKLLDTKLNNYIASIYIKEDNAYNKSTAIALSDVSTGEFLVAEVNLDKITEFLSSYAPSEIVLSKNQWNDIAIYIEKLSYKPAISKVEDWIFEFDFCYDKLIKQFDTMNLKGFGLDKNVLSVQASGCLLNYISENQLGILYQIKSIKKIDTNEFISLDPATRRNLEITFSNSEITKNGTLFAIIDKTVTPMGSRLLKKWLSMPLKNIDKIKERLNNVEALLNHPIELTLLRAKLEEVSDIERIVSKIASLRANPRDCISLGRSLSLIPLLKRILNNTNNKVLMSLADKLPELNEVSDFILNTIKEEPSLQIGSGNIFQVAYNPELDSYIEAKFESKNLINHYQEEERIKSGISNLKVSFNNVFGYYIEISKINSQRAPEYYERKQTLTNAERYTTPELKQLEVKILSAEDKITELESTLFKGLLNKLSEYIREIQIIAYSLSELDALHSYAFVSSEYNYTKPEIDDSLNLHIIDGRHPVVERLLPAGTNFVPNSTYMDNESGVIHIITGPNMSGKSSYLRQVAVIVLLAQSGCFVPAKEAKIGLVDKIFTRVGAQDNITAGESTFLVEMQETANILNNATERSLILLDEVGRGTATFDGVSIAWAIAEYIHNILKTKTLFATHYHELNDLEARYSKIKNYRVEVIETGSTIIFSHKVSKGGSDYSFGIYVAKMAGLPYGVIDRANEIMKLLETESADVNEAKHFKHKRLDISSIKTEQTQLADEQLAIFEFRDDALRGKISKLKIEQLTPIQALNLLMELQKEIKAK